MQVSIAGSQTCSLTWKGSSCNGVVVGKVCMKEQKPDWYELMVNSMIEKRAIFGWCPAIFNFPLLMFRNIHNQKNVGIHL